MTENEISNKIVGAALEIHRSLGPCLLESVYKECLDYKLKQMGLEVKKEKPSLLFTKKYILSVDIE